jgi:antitoxin component of MazEF toxin-antitoxin module
MTTTKHVIQWGNSLGIQISKAMAQHAGIEPGSAMTVTSRPGKLIFTIIPEKKSRTTPLSLTQLLDGMTPAIHQTLTDKEWLTMKPVGKEII